MQEKVGMVSQMILLWWMNEHLRALFLVLGLRFFILFLLVG
jgi:hypothetical protein